MTEIEQHHPGTVEQVAPQMQMQDHALVQWAYAAQEAHKIAISFLKKRAGTGDS